MPILQLSKTQVYLKWAIMMLLHMEFELAIAFNSSKNSAIKNTKFKIKNEPKLVFYYMIINKLPMVAYAHFTNW